MSNRTENHGVPGSNPGPATSKTPANNRKTKAPDPIARAYGRSHPLCNGPRLQRALRCHQEPKPLSLLEPTFRTPLCVLENFLLQTHTIDNLPAKQGHRSHQILDFARIGE